MEFPVRRNFLVYIRIAQVGTFWLSIKVWYADTECWYNVWIFLIHAWRTFNDRSLYEYENAVDEPCNDLSLKVIQGCIKMTQTLYQHSVSSYRTFIGIMNVSTSAIRIYPRKIFLTENSIFKIKNTRCNHFVVTRKDISYYYSV